MRPRRVSWIGLLLLAACQGRTEIVVGVATDLQARGQIDDVTLVASRNGSVILQHEWMLTDVPAGNYELPGSFGLYSPDGAETRFQVDVVGSKSGQPLMTRTSILSLVNDQTLFVRMGLVGDCATLDAPTCQSGESCVEGVCRPLAVDSRRLPAYNSQLVAAVACQSGTLFVKSSTGDPMPLLGSGCGDDQYCEEGTCYQFLSSEDGALAQGLWVDEPTPTTNALRGTWATPDGLDLFAVGEHGIILHLQGGGAWVLEPSGTKQNLYGVWGTAVNDVWAVGEGGLILHRVNDWQPFTAPAVDRLNAVWGDGPADVWAAGHEGADQGVAEHFDGSAWTVDGSLGQTPPLHAVFTDGAGTLYVAGGPALFTRAGSGWSALAGIDASADLQGLGGVPGGPVYAVGRRGFIARVDGGLVLEDSGTSVDLFALVGAGAGDFRVVGDFGFIARGPGTWTAEPSHTHQPIFAVTRAGNDLWAVARDGVALHAVGGMGGNPDLAAPCAGAGCSCVHDGDCSGGFFCGAVGGCQQRKTQGSACNTDAAGDCLETGCRECKAGFFCTDHVCCDQSPQQCGGCSQCTAPTGTCVAVPSGQDPHAACAGATAECTQTACNGKGTCNNTGNACGSDSCAASLLTTHSCADGTCTPNTPAAPCPGGSGCNPAGTACLSKCAADSDCTAPFFCNKSGGCQSRKAAGAAGTCNFAGDCIDALNCRECNAGLTCIDGYCCGGPCGGTCQACDVTGMEGACAPVTSGNPHGARSCGGGPDTIACTRFCSAASTTVCQFSTAACGANSCSTNELLTHSCVTGTCTANPLAPCSAGYLCPAGKSACNTSCATDADCDTANAYYCAKGTPGVCTLQKNPGATCNRPSDCQDLANCHLCKGTNTCIDGFCCAGPCAAACRACDASGACNRIGAAGNHLQPVSGHGTCPGGGSGACGEYCDGSADTCISTDGRNCGGAPACSAANNWTIVGQATCSGGSCGTAPTNTCYPYACSAAVCTVNCPVTGQSTNCAVTAPDPLDSNPVSYVCSLAAAAPGYCGKPNGRKCNDPPPPAQSAECASGNCVANLCCDQACQVGCVNDGKFTGYNDATTTADCSTGTCNNSPIQCPNPGRAQLGATARPFLCSGTSCFNTCHCLCRSAAGGPTTTPCANQTDCTSAGAGWSCPNLCAGSTESPECPANSGTQVFCHPTGPNNPGAPYCQQG